MNKIPCRQICSRFLSLRNGHLNINEIPGMPLEYFNKFSSQKVIMQSILRANYSYTALACNKGVSRRFVDIAGQTANKINIKRYSLFSEVNSSLTSASLMELEQKYIIHQIVFYMPSTITFNKFSFHLLLRR